MKMLLLVTKMNEGEEKTDVTGKVNSSGWSLIRQIGISFAVLALILSQFDLYEVTSVSFERSTSKNTNLVDAGGHSIWIKVNKLTGNTWIFYGRNDTSHSEWRKMHDSDY